MDPRSSGKYYRSLTTKPTLTTTDVTGAAYASTSGDPATFVIPGNASPRVDGTPVYATVEDVVAGGPAATTVGAAARVRIDGPSVATGPGGSAVYPVHVDGDTAGFMLASTLRPRDSAAPRVWEADDGGATFSPNGDGSQDDWTLALRLSEPATWIVRVRDGDTQLKRWDGDVATDAPSVTWSPAVGAVPDGTYTWVVQATDAWGNRLETEGRVVVDTHPPDVTVADAEGDGVPTFTPNGDGSRDTISFGVGSSEPGAVIGTVDGDGFAAHVRVAVGASGATLGWDGRRDGGGYVPDGRYVVAIAAMDRAGNVGTAQERTVDVYGALADVATSKPVFYPQDGDTLGRTTTLSSRSAPTPRCRGTIEDASGDVVRTLKTDEPLGAGSYSSAWNGRTDAGAFVPRGTYRAVVRASNGSQVAAQAVSVVADAFKVVASDGTPARRQKITVTATSGEALDATPRLAVYQPGIDVWRVTMAKVSSGVYRVSITLKASQTGTLRLRVYSSDAGGETQSTSLYLPLH